MWFLAVHRTRTLCQCASLRMGLRFVFARHFAQMNAATSPSDSRKRIGKRRSGSIQFSG